MPQRLALVSNFCRCALAATLALFLVSCSQETEEVPISAPEESKGAKTESRVATKEKEAEVSTNQRGDYLSTSFRAKDRAEKTLDTANEERKTQKQEELSFDKPRKKKAEDN
ncbi:MAG: hypothetical protein K1X53_06450 [Candidatus Sumerlaeaceae bacterium]|nr:hypothetical protein [Candidatus Sumerlaeaceae bacterium]